MKSSKRIDTDMEALSAWLMDVEHPDDFIFKQIKRNKAIIKNVLEKEKIAMLEQRSSKSYKNISFYKSDM